MTQYVCPACKSENIQRLSVVYESGISNVHAQSSGVATGHGVRVTATTNTTGTVQTSASRRAAPPAKRSIIRLIISIGAIFILINGFFAIIISTFWRNSHNFAELVVFIAAAAFCITLGARWLKKATHYNKNIYPHLMREWNNSYLCNRCNNIFEIKPES